MPTEASPTESNAGLGLADNEIWSLPHTPQAINPQVINAREPPGDFMRVIPRELRDMIYRYVWRAGPQSKSEYVYDLAGPYNGPVDISNDCFKPKRFEVLAYSIMEENRYYPLEGNALLLVNKQISGEARIVGMAECKLQMIFVDDRVGSLLRRWQTKNPDLSGAVKDISIIPDYVGSDRANHEMGKPRNIREVLEHFNNFTRLENLQIMVCASENEHFDFLLPFMARFPETEGFLKLSFHLYGGYVFAGPDHAYDIGATREYYNYMGKNLMDATKKLWPKFLVKNGRTIKNTETFFDYEHEPYYVQGQARVNYHRRWPFNRHGLNDAWNFLGPAVLSEEAETDWGDDEWEWAEVKARKETRAQWTMRMSRRRTRDDWPWNEDELEDDVRNKCFREKYGRDIENGGVGM